MGGAEDFTGRLARLRRERSAPPPDPEPTERPPASAPLPGWLGRTLARRMGRGPGAPPATLVEARLEQAAAAWETLPGEPADLEEANGDLGAVAVRTRRLPAGTHRHGAFTLDEVRHADPEAIARLARDPALASMDLTKAVYLDTETSGLGGGAGTYVYMVGLGWFEGSTWVSWQAFMRHPGEERALLAAVAERIAAHPCVVSFFGKSFDRHRLEDKMRICGVDPPFEGRPHLDLYYPLRRLTRGAFGDGKLQTMERGLLGFRRERDLPGALAPAAWFDYLAGRPHRLEGVFHHNHEDVLSLCVLAALLGRAVREQRSTGDALPGPADRRACALAETAASPEEALRWAGAALARDVQGEDRRRMQVLRADLLRRARDPEGARVAYRDALMECLDDRHAVTLLTGASMLQEHQLGDRTNALANARRARELAVRLGLAKGEVAALDRRIARLAGG